MKTKQKNNQVDVNWICWCEKSSTSFTILAGKGMIRAGKRF